MSDLEYSAFIQYFLTLWKLVCIVDAVIDRSTLFNSNAYNQPDGIIQF